MSLFAKARLRARHRLLVSLANNLVRDGASTVNGATKVTPADYLNAVLVARGLPRLGTETAA